MPAVAELDDVSTQVMEPISFIQKGQMTVPKHLRSFYHIAPGTKGVMIPMARGFMVLVDEPQTPAIFDKVRASLGTENMSLEDMVVRMRRIRDTSDYEG